MGTLVDLAAARREGRRRSVAADAEGTAEIVIFPGIRVQRWDIDLSVRVRDVAGSDHRPKPKKPRKRS